MLPARAMRRVDEIRWKVKRAEDHLEDFKANYKGHRGPVFPPNHVGLFWERHLPHVIIDSNPLEPDQRRWLGILIGDVIHQLRSSLDHLVYALATRDGRTLPTKGQLRDLEFLIRKDRQHFASDWRVSQGILERLVGGHE